MASFFARHQLIVGLLLVFFGVSDLWFVLPNLHGTFQGFNVSWEIPRFYLPQSTFMIPLLSAMTLVGTLLLSVYCIRGIAPGEVDNKEHAAFLVAALGFTYLVIGAWPLWSQSYFWPWQQEIAAYGNLLVLPLYAGSLFAFAAGAASLYIHSRIYRQQHPEMTDQL